MHASYVASLLRYRSQLARISPQTVREYRGGVQRLVKALWSMMPYAAVCNFRHLGLPTDFIGITALNQSTRLVDRSSEAARPVSSEVDADIEWMNAALWPAREWHAHSLISAVCGPGGGGPAG